MFNSCVTSQDEGFRHVVPLVPMFEYLYSMPCLGTDV